MRNDALSLHSFFGATFLSSLNVLHVLHGLTVGMMAWMRNYHIKVSVTITVRLSVLGLTYSDAFKVCRMHDLAAAWTAGTASRELFNNSTCVYIAPLKSLSAWQRHRGVWHRLSRTVSPYQLALPKFALANIPPNINILPAVWGGIWKCSIISLGFIWEHPSSESSTWRIFIPHSNEKEGY